MNNTKQKIPSCDRIFVLELVTGLEPATCSLRMSCTTNCATQAKYYPKLYNTKTLLSRLKKRIFYGMMFLLIQTHAYSATRNRITAAAIKTTPETRVAPM